MHSSILTLACQMIHSDATVNHSNDSRHDLTNGFPRVNLTFAFFIPKTLYVDVWSSDKQTFLLIVNGLFRETEQRTSPLWHSTVERK